jgi:hypothetical protein
MVDKKRITRLREGVYMLPKYKFNKGLIETGESMLLGFVTRLEEGATPEGVILAVIDDLIQKNEEVPSKETESAIDYLKNALRSLEIRDADRAARGVTSTNNP